jgi:cyanophycin synthetase
VAERVPAHVVGDGRRTVRELAEEINRDPKRDRYNPDQTLVPLPLDDLTAACLARGGRTLDTVPAAGERVQLRATANVSTGGTSVDRTDEIHPRNAALCALAVAAVGLDIAGIDVLTPDISVPFRENGATIIEVNASPGIRMHTHPDEGVPRDVPGAVLDMLYPPGAEAAIPVVAVTGTRGTAEAAREIARRLRQPGRCVGCATAEGFFLDGERLLEGDYSGAAGAGLVLSHRGVDLAVLDTPAADVRRSGLGFEACDVAVVLDREEEAVRVVAGVVKPGGVVIDLAEEGPPAPGAANP